MRYLLLPSLLFSTVLACQTKHQVAIDAVDDFDSEDNETKEFNPDAGEGAKAKAEEGKIGKTDTVMVAGDLIPYSETMTVDNTGAQPAPTGSNDDSSDRNAELSTAKAAAVGQMDAASTTSDPSILFQSLGIAEGEIATAAELSGIIGAKGTQTGTGGLGKSGGGLGGGSTVDGLGGLGTKGAGRGAVGYSTRSSVGSLGKKKSAGTRVPRSAKKYESFSREPLSDIQADVVANGEEYTDYGINPFVQTSDDALSTFSIDVDTASYTIARRKLNEGRLPNYASVRAEEFINFFDYKYDSTGLTQANPFHVEMDMMNHPFKDDREVLRVGLQGMEYTLDTRPPLHLTFLVDVSGSMSSQDKLPLAKESMHMLVDTLREDDTVALATYAGNISKILDPTFGDNKKAIHAAIDRLNAGGSTAMSSGLDLAYEMAWESFEPGAENRVIVLSDGDANVGRTGWETMISQIQSYADRGVTMSTMGFGMGNYKDTRMEQLANNGDGNNFYIDSKAQAHRVFVEDFNSTMLSIARDVKIQVEFNPETVQSYRLIGYENRDIADKDFRNDRVDAGEVGSGHNVTALYEVVLADKVGRNESLVTTRLRYEKPGPDSVATEKSWMVSRSDIHDGNHATELAFAAGTFAELMRRSPYTGGISMSDLQSYAKDIVQKGDKDEQELLALIKQADDLNAGPSLVTR